MRNRHFQPKFCPEIERDQGNEKVMEREYREVELMITEENVQEIERDKENGKEMTEREEENGKEMMEREVEGKEMMEKEEDGKDMMEREEEDGKDMMESEEENGKDKTEREEENAKERPEREEENRKDKTEREEEKAKETTEREENGKGEENDKAPTPPRKKRRRAGELSGRQMAIQKFEKDGRETFTVKMPPNARNLLRELRKVLTTFTGGYEEGFTQEEAAAMRIYTSLKLGLKTTVRLLSSR